LYTALSSASHPLVIVVACDMPFVNASLLAAQSERLMAAGGEAVIPQGKNGLEPFHAVYRRAACLSLIQSALEAGKRRVDSWFEQARIIYFSDEEIKIHDPHEVAFSNINTLEELQQAEHSAREFPWL
jgi:molybdopterin-guanine dinucleotide biosynthesis protein A